MEIMTTDRIKEIQSKTAYPESVSVMIALKQVWNECEQDQLAIQRVSNRRELLIDLLTSLEKDGGNRFVSKEWIADNYLQGN